jgi:hypothetical protein
LFRTKGFHDAVTGERLGAEMRQLLLRLLAAARRPPDALPQPNQRVDDEGRYRQAGEGQPRIDPEHQAREADEGQRLPRQIADRFRRGLLHLADIVADTREQPAGGALREEPRRLAEDVAVQLVAHIHHDALPDVGHQVRRRVRPHALEEVNADHRPRDDRDLFLPGQQVVEDRLDQVSEPGRADGVDHHAEHGPREPRAIRKRIAEQATQRRALPHH